MRYTSWSRDKLSRLLIVAGTLCLYVVLEIVNAFEVFGGPTIRSFSAFWLYSSFGILSFVSLIFLAVGSLVWLYARERRVASLLFAFSVVMMGVFIASANLDADQRFSSLGSMGASVALALVSTILFYFPQNILSDSNPSMKKYKIYFSCYLLFSSIFMGISLLVHLNVFSIYRFDSIVLLYYSVGFGIIVSITIGFNSKLASVRKKQQIRIFAGGLIASFVPLFLLTILPSLLNFGDYSVDGRYTSLAGILFPLALGYSILRYQLLVLDTYIHRVVSFIVGILALAILVYAAIIAIGIFLHGNVSPLAAVVIVVSFAIFAPLIWWLSRKITIRLLFPEIIRYNRVIKEPLLVSEDVLHVDDVARKMTDAALKAFDIPQVCVLVLDENSAFYQLSPTFSDAESDAPRLALFTVLRRMVAPTSNNNDGHRLSVRLPAFQRLLSSRRPVLLSEVLFSKEEGPRGLSRVMNANPLLEQDDYLLAPLWSQGQMLGVLVLGERADNQLYAGPDFEIARILTGRFSPLLGNAWLSERASKHDEQRKELEAQTERFIAVASHEFRTPLTSVQGYIELLCEYDVAPEMRAEFLRQARMGCDDLNLMVNNMLDAHLVHGDVGKIHLHPVSLSLAVQHVLGVLNASIEGEQHSVCTSVDSTLSVLADDLRLCQILMNLLSNALKYSAPTTRIEISAVQENMQVQVSVRDYGLGIPPDKQHLLFKRLMRLERDLNSPIRGAGLGLYICERYVTAMGGRIWVESSGVPGEGCVFTFVLQCAPADQVQEVKAEELKVS